MLKSEQISDFLDFLKECAEQYEIQYTNVGNKDKEKCDLLHKLELKELTYHQIAHLGEDLKKVCEERRVAKDEVVTLSPIKDYYESNIVAIKTLERLLGDVRKAEKSLENRIYIPRILKEHEDET